MARIAASWNLFANSHRRGRNHYPDDFGKTIHPEPGISDYFVVLLVRALGVPGALLAVPILAVAKIVCDRVEPLHPAGHLIGG